MKNTMIAVFISALFVPAVASADTTFASLTKQWTYNHTLSGVTGYTAEISAFDSLTNSLWVAGVSGVDVLNASNGSLIQHIDTTSFGSINSVAIHNGIAAFAMESNTRTDAGTIKFFDTTTRTLSSGINSVTVGALPDMITFTKDGSKLLVANEGTPLVYDNPALDPAGSVSIINMSTRTVEATVGFAGVAQTGSYLRTNTGMDFEPEYIAVNATGTKAYVSLQEANAMAVLDLTTNTFSSVIGLGAKDFSATGNYIDPNDRDYISGSSGPTKSILRASSVVGLYQPDGMVAYEANGQTFIVMANEGDTREDDGDKVRASSLSGTPTDLRRLNISSTDSTPGNLVTFGARSFSIRDESGNIVFDSGSILDAKAIELGIYDDTRSDDKGVEPEGVELMVIGNRTYAFIGLERTTKAAVAIFDVTNPANASFIDMIVTDGDVAPEGLLGFQMGGIHYLAIANEVSNTTSVYSLAPVPEPETYAMLLAGLGLLGFTARRRKSL
ncbi:MAG: choice-of-anchor I family protein [Methylotenera sp.]|jgi:DNA-binding beta-propeller fold protein YncE|uniref:choice-of-anchor I family protein n=1 Tax=Methylotenera sp. TaxID=2051956 RepID=UPI002722F263|nr:choice-of-anchor I family protein [Methylotenera sp.]MDO9149899.1 choice-of-anchor I family protein [Methylotenera sp.]